MIIVVPLSSRGRRIELYSEGHGVFTKRCPKFQSLIRFVVERN